MRLFASRTDLKAPRTWSVAAGAPKSCTSSPGTDSRRFLGDRIAYSARRVALSSSSPLSLMPSSSQPQAANSLAQGLSVPTFSGPGTAEERRAPIVFASSSSSIARESRSDASFSFSKAEAEATDSVPCPATLANECRRLPKGLSTARLVTLRKAVPIIFNGLFVCLWSSERLVPSSTVLFYYFIYLFFWEGLSPA